MPKSQNISDILGLETYPNTNIKTFKFGDRERNYGELEGTNLKAKIRKTYDTSESLVNAVWDKTGSTFWAGIRTKAFSIMVRK